MGKMKKSKFKTSTAAFMVAVMLFSPEAMAQTLSDGAAAQITAAIALTEDDLESNSGTIKILLQKCMDELESDDPAAATLQSVIVLLDTGSADAASVAVLLRSLVDGEAASAQAENQDILQEQQSSDVYQEYTSENQETDETEEEISELGLPVYKVASFIKTILGQNVLVDVPGNWGNNASGRALTSYSPVNDSGAISPAAGTLTISYFPMEGENETEAFDSYEKNIAAMSVTTYINSEDVTAAELPARKIEFIMSVGANQFSCETVCFAYEKTIYAIELMQGQQTTYDYFPMYRQVVDSAEAGSEEMISEALSKAAVETAASTETPVEPETAASAEAPVEPETVVITEAPVEPETVVITEAPVESETVAITEAPVESETVVHTETPAESEPAAITEAHVEPETAASTEAPVELENQMVETLPGDMGTFQYQLNGHVYQFPTAVSELAEGDLPLNRQLTLPYDFSSDADMADGYWTELVNTQYYYFENALHKEMAGVTNMSGYPVMMSQGVLTALIDTQGTYVDVVLPGGVKVGSPESDIVKGFPEFAGRVLDGTAAFRGNELLYACNVRDDGCNGYVLIRNDAPYYSAVSIICENGIIKEISFECLGSVRADGVFLP